IDSARGNMSPFVSRNFLVADEVIIKVVFLSLMIEMIAYLLIEKGYGSDVRLVFLLVTIFILPSIYMLIALTDSLLIALNPAKFLKIISISFVQYLLFVIFWIITKELYDTQIQPFAIKYLPLYLEQMVFQFVKYALLVLNFQIMGYMIFQNRSKYHLEDIGFKEVLDDEVLVKYINIVPAHENIKHLLKIDEPERALAIANELKENGDFSQALQNLHKEASDQSKYTPTNIDISRRVHKYLNNKGTRKAYQIAIDQIRSGNQYLEKSPFDISRLIRFAVQSNQTSYIKHLLKDFHIKYPYHEDIVLNYFQWAKILYKERKTRHQSKEILQFLVDNYPNDRSLPEVIAWYKGFKLIAKNKKLLWP
ncbi:MAG: hypothetical protein L3J83_08630, partial [Proteobacteria bacterium]|nr:hypothetical protein [Pseudomonadota bacterium]